MNANIYCEERKSYLDMTLDAYDPLSFLREYPQPAAAFKGPVSHLYRQHVEAYLSNRFPAMDSSFIRHTIDACGPRLAEANRALAAIDLEDVSATPRSLRPHQPMPAEVDRGFYDELLYVIHRDEIEEMAEALEASRQERYAAASDQISCPCCLDDWLPEDLVTCPSGHAFCPGCVQKCAELALGQGKAELTCLAHKCPHVYESSQTREVLKPSTLRALQRRARSHAAPQAPHVESCPYCHIPCDMAEVTGDTFLCPDPECARSSCRLCGGASHPNKACRRTPNKARRRTPLAHDMAAFVTSAISEAVLRTCGQCHSRVVKEAGGCNHITCSCGAEFCYVCQKTIDGYDHFSQTNCSMLYNDDVLQQQHEVRVAAERALKQYRRKYRHAPKLDLDAFLKRLGGDLLGDNADADTTPQANELRDGDAAWDEEPAPETLAFVDAVPAPDAATDETAATRTPSPKDYPAASGDNHSDEKEEEQGDAEESEEEEDDDDDDEDYGYYDFL